VEKLISWRTSSLGNKKGLVLSNWVLPSFGSVSSSSKENLKLIYIENLEQWFSDGSKDSKENSYFLKRFLKISDLWFNHK
jgi:hypothetical protein